MVVLALLLVLCHLLVLNSRLVARCERVRLLGCHVAVLEPCQLLMGVLLGLVVVEGCCCCLGDRLGVGEVVWHGIGVVEEEHVEVLFEVGVSLCLTHVVVLAP